METKKRRPFSLVISPFNFDSPVDLKTFIETKDIFLRATQSIKPASKFRSDETSIAVMKISNICNLAYTGKQEDSKK